MTHLGLKEAATYTDCELYRRGKLSVATQIQEARASDAAVADAVNERNWHGFYVGGRRMVLHDDGLKLSRGTRHVHPDVAGWH